MARLLIVVNTAERYPGWACRVKGFGDRPHVLLTPGIDVLPGERFRPGESLLLKRPFDATIVSQIAGFITISGYGYGRPGDWVVCKDCLVVRDLQPEDIPPGTEVWSVDKERGKR